MTPCESRQWARDHGKHAAKAQAIVRLGLILEYDPDSPPPAWMTHVCDGGKVSDVFWGIAALPSAGDEAGCAAVDRWAARHHADVITPAGWEDGRYCAVMHLGGGYRYGVSYTPERTLRPVPAPGEEQDAPQLQAVA
jgi:hypothetical protein